MSEIQQTIKPSQQGDPKPIEAKQKADEQPEIPLFRDSTPLGSAINELTFPKLKDQALIAPNYQVNTKTRLIENLESLGLKTKEDDPEKPNVAILDTTNPIPESDKLSISETAYRIHSSHLRSVIEEFPKSFELKAAYAISDKERIDISHINTALTHLLANCESEKIQYLNCSYSGEMTYGAAIKIMAEYGPKDFTGIISPDTLRENREVLAEAITKYLGTAEGRVKYPQLLEEAKLNQALIDKGVKIIASAGNDGLNSFEPLHVLVPGIIIVGGTNASAIDSRSTNHSLVDTAQSFWTSDGGRYKSGTSFAAPSALANVHSLSKYSRTTTELNDILLADFNVRVKGQLNTIPIASTIPMLTSIVSTMESTASDKSSREKIELTAKSLETLAPRLFASEVAVLKIMAQHPDSPGKNALDLLKGLNLSLAAESISVKDFEALYGVFVKLPAERQQEVLATLEKTQLDLAGVKDALSK